MPHGSESHRKACLKYKHAHPYVPTEEQRVKKLKHDSERRIKQVRKRNANLDIVSHDPESLFNDE